MKVGATLFIFTHTPRHTTWKLALVPMETILTDAGLRHVCERGVEACFAACRTLQVVGAQGTPIIIPGGRVAAVGAGHAVQTVTRPVALARTTLTTALAWPPAVEPSGEHCEQFTVSHWDS